MIDPRPNVASWFAGKNFTTDWLSGHLNVWLKVLAPLREQPVEILEVGSYEGRSAVAFLEYLGHSRITCIDSFHWPDHPTLGPAIEKRFDSNLAPYSDRITKIKARAIPSLDALSAEGRRFDVIYLDAGKQREGTFAQSATAWPLLKTGGILIWDDLTWGADKPSADRPEHGIRLFRASFHNCLTILHEGDQMIAKKLRDWPHSEAPLAPALRGAPEQTNYWEQRKDCAYLRAVCELARVVAADATSLIDVGTNGCPYLENIDWIPRRVSLDLTSPYRSQTVQGITADFLKWASPERFDLCLCLQVLEHIPDAPAFARKLLATAPRLIVSVPYLWPANSCKWHVHDPVDEAKVESWFGRAPDRQIVVTEPNDGANSRRLICYFEQASERATAVTAVAAKPDLAKVDLHAKPAVSVAATKGKLQRTAMNVVNTPRVSIIVTHHNYSEFIADAIDSVLNQNYKNFDCIIVDDCSDFPHQRKLREVYETRRSEKLRLIFNDSNLGQIPSFYRGVDSTDADFVCLLDPDDRYLQGFVSEMVAAHLNPYVVAPMVCCGQIYSSAGRQLTGVSLTNRHSRALRDGIELGAEGGSFLKFYESEDAGWPWTSTSSMMYRRAAAQIMRPVVKLGYKRAADAYLARGAQFLGGTLVFDKPLVVRQVHESNSWLTSAVLSSSQRKFGPGAVQMEPRCRMDVFVNILENNGREFFSDEHFHNILTSCFDADQRAAMAERSPFVDEFCRGAHQGKVAYEYYASTSREWRRDRGWLVASRRVLSHVLSRVPITIFKLAMTPVIRPFSEAYYQSRVARCHRRLKGAAGAVAGLFSSSVRR